MKILLDEEDKPHTLDLGLRKGNPIYTGCVFEEAAYSEPPAKIMAMAEQPGLMTKVSTNLESLLEKMPSTYVIITGIAPQWVKMQAALLAGKWVEVLYSYDGKNVLPLYKGERS